MYGYTQRQSMPHISGIFSVILSSNKNIFALTIDPVTAIASFSITNLYVSRPIDIRFACFPYVFEIVYKDSTYYIDEPSFKFYFCVIISIICLTSLWMLWQMDFDAILYCIESNKSCVDTLMQIWFYIFDICHGMHGSHDSSFVTLTLICFGGAAVFSCRRTSVRGHLRMRRLVAGYPLSRLWSPRSQTGRRSTPRPGTSVPQQSSQL